MIFELGMPHLNYNGLDPVWLSKILAEIHWEFLKPISSINDQNQRLYASVFAFEIDFQKGQNYFKEFDNIEIKSKIFKFNNQIFRSEHEIQCSLNTAYSKIDTIFVKKDLNSNTLIRDNPVHSDQYFEKTENIFLQEHKDIKKITEINNSNEYNELPFNPEAYFNGVKILYFANYINLIYLSEYLTFNKILDPIKTIKIFFYGNINPHDKMYGSSKKEDNNYITILKSHDRIKSYCVITR